MPLQVLDHTRTSQTFTPAGRQRARTTTPARHRRPQFVALPDHQDANVARKPDVAVHMVILNLMAGVPGFGVQDPIGLVTRRARAVDELALETGNLKLETNLMNLNLTTATRYGLNVLAALGLSIALYLGRSIFVPLTIAGLLAAILWPAASWLKERVRLPWFVASATVIAVMVAILLLLFILIGVSIPRILNDLPNPSRPDSMPQFYDKLRGQFNNALPFNIDQLLPKDPEQSGVYLEMKKFLQGDQITNLLLSLSGQGLGVLTETVLVLFILLFLLMEGQMLADKIRRIFGPAQDVQNQVSVAFRQMAESVRSYLVWRTIVNIGLGLLLGGVYAAAGLKQPVLWALLTVILCYIPYLGTIAAGVMPILDALLNVNPLVAFGLLVFYVTVVTVEGYIIVPWVMGRSMDLNATTVIVSCLYWYLVWGTAGLFLAMPIMAAIKAICLQVPGWAGFGHLMGSEEMPPPTPEEVVKLAVAGHHSANGEVAGAAKPTIDA